MSGHGGQIRDREGDEDDRLDETLCLWDGQLADDVMWEALLKVPAGVRVAFITDSCNSGTNYRAPHDYVKPMRARARKSGTELKCDFLHFAGCPDGKSSYGGSDGGVFTTALLGAYYDNLKLTYTDRFVDMTWKQWFEAARSRMPKNQTPVMSELGHVFSTERRAMK